MTSRANTSPNAVSFGLPGSTVAPSMPAPVANWAGIGSFGSGGGGCDCAPPDTNGDVGPNHYVQVVNTNLAVLAKTGAVLYGPVPINTLWQGFGGDCDEAPALDVDGVAVSGRVDRIDVEAPPGGGDGEFRK